MPYRTLILLYIVFFIKTILVFFIGYTNILYLSLFSTILLLFVSVRNLLKSISAIAIAILGFSVLSFFDIFKFNFVFTSLTSGEIIINEAHHLTAIFIYLSFQIFLTIYLLTNRKAKFISRSSQIDVRKLFFYFFPFSFGILILYLIVGQVLDGNNVYLLLLSYIPKSAAVVAFYLYLRRKKVIYLVLFGVLLLSFSEVSRRSYITLAFIIVPLLMSYFIKSHGQLRVVHRLMLVILFGGAFFFMNYLRAGWGQGEHMGEQDKLDDTFAYMMSFKAIDTFDNTAYIVDNFPEKYPYYYGSTYAFFILQYIPRAFWPNKPGAFGAALGLLRKKGIRNFTVEAWQDNTRGFSLSPGLLGEAYANFGLFGVFLLPGLLGYLTKWFDTRVRFQNLIDNFNLLPYISFYSAFFLVHRGDFVSALYYSVFFFMVLSLIAIIFREKTYST